MKKQIDELTREELGKVWEIVQAGKVKAARQFFPDKPKDYVKHTKDIGHYAINKIVAIKLLVEHCDKETSKKYSKICAGIWSDLPTWARSIEF